MCGCFHCCPLDCGCSCHTNAPAVGRGPMLPLSFRTLRLIADLADAKVGAR